MTSWLYPVMLNGLVLVPLLAAAVAAARLRHWDDTQAARWGLGAGALELLLAAALIGWARPFGSPVNSVSVDYPWIPALDVRWQLHLDGLSVPLVALTALLSFLVALYLTKIRPAAGKLTGLVAAIQLVIAGAMGTFLAADLIVFFIAFELVLLPMWLIIAIWGDPSSKPRAMGFGSATPGGLQARSDASWRFLLYTGLGSAVMLVGLIWLILATGTSDIAALTARAGDGLSASTQTAIAVLILVGLLVKTPAWPLHTWLAPAHTIAPTVGSVLLAGVLLKLGTYAMVRLVLGPLPLGLAAVAPVLAVLGVVGILWAGSACLVQQDLKRLIALSSVAHMGFVLVGIASGTVVGLQGAMFANVAHGVISALLFFVVGALKDRHHSADIAVLGGDLRERLPRLGWMLAFAAIASLGLPGLAGFWGELLSITGAWQSADLDALAGPVAVLAALGTFVAGAYAIRIVYRLWFADAQTDSATDPREAAAETTSESLADLGVVQVGDAQALEVRVMAPLVIATIVLGLVPAVLLDATIGVVESFVGIIGGMP